MEAGGFGSVTRQVPLLRPDAARTIVTSAAVKDLTSSGYHRIVADQAALPIDGNNADSSNIDFQMTPQ